MPELPEVETVANGVNDRIRAEVIESVWLSRYKEPFKTPPRPMADALTGTRIDRVRRVGKHIVFDLIRSGQDQPTQDQPTNVDQPASVRRPNVHPNVHPNVQWTVHLGMTGRLLVSTADVPVPPHTHAILHLSSGRELRFVDARRFGRLALHLPGRSGDGFQGPGREPLTISAEDFAALFRHRRLPIKAALLNQRLLHGVGNIYADESLFRAGIRPTRMAGRLTRERLARLHAGLQTVLRDAIRLGGSSVSDYVDADGAAGFFQLHHYVYMRTGQPCLTCGTPIRRTVIGGRGTHYCPTCQR
ncbi:MAG: bifunctional DNA-formamidopyrimidine glycosylase/DNA-(apurinic or apyrimidinic site) lyase [Silvibacterium sp.]|nr:bifunctional DNA-formamidopyrimidine glycosylase/DNA-(apurinic or apyrimidinic site) lyase [Silvibacterium sp.]